VVKSYLIRNQVADLCDCEIVGCMMINVCFIFRNINYMSFLFCSVAFVKKQDQFALKPVNLVK